MNYSETEIVELKPYCKTVSAAEEGNLTYFLLEELLLPEGCEPAVTDALLCPSPRDGYNSRLFFAERIKGHFDRNWNSNNVRILERNWFAFSWKVETPNLRLAQILTRHLEGFVLKG